MCFMFLSTEYSQKYISKWEYSSLNRSSIISSSAFTHGVEIFIQYPARKIFYL